MAVEDEPQPGSMRIQVGVDHYQPGIPMPMYFPHPSLLQGIGLLMIHWGTFENIFQEYFSAHCRYAGMNVKKFQASSFRRRASRLCLATRKIFEDDSSQVTFIDGVCKKANEISWYRNTIAHGDLRIEMPSSASGEFTKFFMSRPYDGELRTIELTEDAVSQVWHDAAHLAGALIHALDPDASDALPLSPDERLAFRSILEFQGDEAPPAQIQLPPTLIYKDLENLSNGSEITSEIQIRT